MVRVEEGWGGGVLMGERRTMGGEMCVKQLKLEKIKYTAVYLPLSLTVFLSKPPPYLRQSIYSTSLMLSLFLTGGVNRKAAAVVAPS